MRYDHFSMLPELAFRALGGRMTLEGGGKGSAPPAPDYTGAAREQAAASKEVATQQNYANRPDQTSPWGGTSWNTAASTDPSTGQAVTTWQQNQTLNPNIQGALDSQIAMQQGRSDLANSTMGRVQNDVAQPWNFNQFNRRQGMDISSPSLDTSTPGQLTQNIDPNMFSADRRRIEDSMIDRLRPEQDLQMDRLNTQLSNQGLTQGSAAYNDAQKRLLDQHSRDNYNAIAAGGQEQQRMQQALLSQQQQAFNQDVNSQQIGNQAIGAKLNQDITTANFGNTLRAQQIAEEAQRRGMSLNEMNALISGQQVQTPQMPQFMGGSNAQQAPNLLGAAQATGNYNMNAWQQEQAANAGLWGGLGQAAGTAAMMFAMSDARLKRNVIKLSEHAKGFGIYVYEIFNRREVGVMAQEVMQVAPELVAVHPSGYLMVNYGGLNHV